MIAANGVLEARSVPMAGQPAGRFARMREVCVGAISEKSSLSLGLILAVVTLVVGVLGGSLALIISSARESGALTTKIDAIAEDISEIRGDVNQLRNEVVALKIASAHAQGK